MTRHTGPRIAWIGSVAPIALVAMVATLGAIPLADVKFTSTFKSLDAGSTSFFGKKVAALVITSDDSLRVPAEEALARELTGLGMQGVATYRIAPKEELAGADRAKPWFDRANVEGVVALRPVSKDTRITSTPGMWSTGYYSTYWGYYGYGWSQAYIPMTYGREEFVVVENTIYNVKTNSLLWAAVADVSDPKGLPKFMAELVKATLKEMQKHGLAKRPPK
jgi:hypothetical protein